MKHKTLLIDFMNAHKDLLKASKKLVKFVESKVDYCIQDKPFVDLKKAIEKAEGEQI